MPIPQRIIPMVDAKEMYDTYTLKRASIIEDYENAHGNPGFKATRFGEWDFEEFKEYLAYLNTINEAIKQAPQYQNGIAGIRFYFGRYVNGTTMASGNPVHSEGNDSYSSRTTFFIIPTLSINNDRVPFSLVKNTNIPVLHSNELSNSNNPNLDSLAMNEANLTPPPYPF